MPTFSHFVQNRPAGFPSSERKGLAQFLAPTPTLNSSALLRSQVFVTEKKTDRQRETKDSEEVVPIAKSSDSDNSADYHLQKRSLRELGLTLSFAELTRTEVIEKRETAAESSEKLRDSVVRLLLLRSSKREQRRAFNDWTSYVAGRRAKRVLVDFAAKWRRKRVLYSAFSGLQKAAAKEKWRRNVISDCFLRIMRHRQRAAFEMLSRNAQQKQRRLEVLQAATIKLRRRKLWSAFNVS